jgi:hypothetical protein
MMKEIAKQLPHYLSLAGILIAGIIGFVVFSYERAFQIAVAIGLALAYVAWGIIHHAIHRDLHLSVVIEYIVVASLGLVVILSLIFRA